MKKIEYRAGDLIWVRPNSWVFKIIRFATKGKFGHVGVIVGSVEGHPLVVEAQKNGIDVNDIKWRHVKKENYTVYRIKGLTENEGRALAIQCLSYVGLPYDSKALLNFVIGSTVFGTDKEMFCSEMAYRALVKLKILQDLHIAEKISPAKLYNLLEPKLEFVNEIEF